MKVLMKKLWSDEAGFIVSTELILVASLLVIAMVVGAATIRDQVVAELGDTAGAVSELNQSVVVYGITGHSSAVAGWDFVDQLDFCDDNEQAAGTDASSCIDLGFTANLNEGATQNAPSGTATPGNNP